MVVGLCSVLVAHSDTYAAHHPRVIKIRREQSFWQAYGDIIKQGVPWVIAVVGILHYRNVASEAKKDVVRDVFECLGSEKRGFPQSVLKDQSDPSRIPVLTINTKTYRLCPDFARHGYAFFCASYGLTQPPTLDLGETKGA